jgi:hypothetical protein
MMQITELLITYLTPHLLCQCHGDDCANKYASYCMLGVSNAVEPSQTRDNQNK